MKPRNSKKTSEDPLKGLVAAAERDALAGLVTELAGGSLQVRRECLEYLKKHVALSPEQGGDAEGEAALALWHELAPDLAELDEYGGGDHETEDHVDNLLYDLQKKLEEGHVPRDYRRELLNKVIPYIESGNGGMDDPLYGVAYAACRDGEDLRDLAERFEAIDKDWPREHARDIYREIGDHEKYLELRSRKMVYGADFHDLAAYHWQRGDKEKAIATAEEGLAKAQGRKDELRVFLADRAKETGNRRVFLNLNFEQTVDELTLDKYKAFEKLCTPEEWGEYRPGFSPRWARHGRGSASRFACIGKITSGLFRYCSKWDRPIRATTSARAWKRPRSWRNALPRRFWLTTAQDWAI